MLKRIFYILSLSLILYSCSQKNETKLPVVSVTPGSVKSSALAGDTVAFSISASSNDGLKSFKIEESIGSNTVILLDTNIGSATFTHTFRYPVKLGDGNKPYIAILRFEATDKNKDRGFVYRDLYVTEGKKLLKKEGPFNMYSAFSGLNSAFDIENLVDVSSGSSADQRDIADNSTSDVLSKTWSAPSGAKLVYAPTFDFANASDTTVYRGYYYGTKHNSLSSLKAGDVVLTRLNGIANANDSIFAAIKIDSVIDLGGASQDKYVISIKKTK